MNFVTVKGILSNVQYFHSDRGMEFKSSLIEELINTFGISRSLSEAGVLYDNAVAEATFKPIKKSLFIQIVRNTTAIETRVINVCVVV